MTGLLRDRLEAALAVPAEPTSDFDLTPAVQVPDVPLRPAAVLVAFDPANDRLVLTKRASGLRHHPGQISLPGGKVDPQDPDDIAAALREADEEVGLAPSNVEVLGRLPPHRTVTGFSMTPVLGLIRDGFIPLPEAGEVAEVFTVPFDLIASPQNYRIERRLWRGDWRAYQTIPCGPYYIWGATARVLYSLARRLNP